MSGPGPAATATTAAAAAAEGPVSRWVELDDPLMVPVLADLTDEYVALYGPGGREEMAKHPAESFTPPGGGVLVLVAAGRAVAAGAFHARGPGLGEDTATASADVPSIAETPTTAEIKRMWTAADHRRQGLARRVLRELEAAAREAGYRSVYVSTGWRQLGAVALYLRAGYRPLFDVDGDPAVPFERGFTTDLVTTDLVTTDP